MSYAIVSPLKGRDYRDQLLLRACSEAWVDAAAPLTRQRNGEFIVERIDPEAFPPPLMKKCKSCERFSPPSGVDGICCDCRADELEERRFLTLSEPAPIRGKLYINIAGHLATDLATEGRWADLCELLQLQEGKEDREVDSDAFLELRVARSRPAYAAAPGHIVQAGDRLLSSDEIDDIGTVNGVLYDHGETLAGAGLFHRPAPNRQSTGNKEGAPVKPSGGKAVGCSLILLSENVESLLNEIGSFLKKGMVCRSARRFSQPNPYIKAPEDFDLTPGDSLMRSASRRTETADEQADE